MSRARPIVPEVAIEVIQPGLPLFHVTGYGDIADAWVFQSPDDWGWHSLFLLPGIGHRLPEHSRHGDRFVPLPAIIATAFPSLCRRRGR